MKFEDEEILEKILCGIIIVLLIVIIGILLFKDFDKDENDETSDVVAAVVSEEKSEEQQESNEVKTIKVDVKGAVKKEGVYELEYGSRVNDAIKAAGGLKSSASTKYLNLSKKIEDETVIKVYTNNQIKNMNIVYEVKEECECPTQEITSCAGASIIEDSTNSDNTLNSSEIDSDTIESSVDASGNQEENINKVSINSGTKEELMTLKGIGSAKADSIIEYRTKNNGFKTLEDIMNVSGIGEAAFEKIKDNIKL